MLNFKSFVGAAICRKKGHGLLVFKDEFMKKIRLAFYFLVALILAVGAYSFYKSSDPRISRIEDLQAGLRDSEAELMAEYAKLKSKASDQLESNMEDPATTEWLNLSRNYIFDSGTQYDFSSLIEKAETAVSTKKYDSAIRLYLELNVKLRKMNSDFNAAGNLYEVQEEADSLRELFDRLKTNSGSSTEKTIHDNYAQFRKAYAEDQSLIAPDLIQAELNFSFAESMYRKGNLADAVKYFQSGNSYMRQILGDDNK